MTSSFKRPQHAFLPPRLDSLSSHLRLVTTLCVRLVTSNLSAIAIFSPSTRCLSDSRHTAAHATFHPAAISWVCRLRPKVVSVAPVSFPSPLYLILDPIDVADHFNVNLCWWSFPYSSAVTWLCQSGCLASTHWTAGSSRALLCTFKDGNVILLSGLTSFQ